MCEKVKLMPANEDPSIKYMTAREEVIAHTLN
jgi:hypothetical protein